MFQPDEIELLLSPACVLSQRKRSMRTSNGLRGVEHHWLVLLPGGEVAGLQQKAQRAGLKEIEAPHLWHDADAPDPKVIRLLAGYLAPVLERHVGITDPHKQSEWLLVLIRGLTEAVDEATPDGMPAKLAEAFRPLGVGPLTHAAVFGWLEL